MDILWGSNNNKYYTVLKYKLYAVLCYLRTAWYPNPDIMRQKKESYGISEES